MLNDLRDMVFGNIVGGQWDGTVGETAWGSSSDGNKNRQHQLRRKCGVLESIWKHVFYPLYGYIVIENIRVQSKRTVWWSLTSMACSSIRATFANNNFQLD